VGVGKTTPYTEQGGMRVTPEKSSSTEPPWCLSTIALKKSCLTKYIDCMHTAHTKLNCKFTQWLHI